MAKSPSSFHSRNRPPEPPPPPGLAPRVAAAAVLADVVGNGASLEDRLSEAPPGRLSELDPRDRALALVGFDVQVESQEAPLRAGGRADGDSAIVFAISGSVVWLAALAVALGSVLGGYLGGRASRTLPNSVLRALVVVVGVGATLYLVFSR